MKERTIHGSNKIYKQENKSLIAIKNPKNGTDDSDVQLLDLRADWIHSELVVSGRSEYLHWDGTCDLAVAGEGPSGRPAATSVIITSPVLHTHRGQNHPGINTELCFQLCPNFIFSFIPFY